MIDGLDDCNTDQYEEVLQDGELFASYSAFLLSREDAYTDISSISVGDEITSKYSSNVKTKKLCTGEKLENTKQKELHRIRDVVWYEPVSESKLQLAPQWVLDEAIQTEVRNYEEQNDFKKL